MVNIFISYSSKDSELALSVYNSLTSNGMSCWLAEKSIMPGENYAMAIISALDSAECVLLLYTGNSNVSPEIHKEIERASSKRMPIVPVRFEDVPYHPALEYHLGVAQWIDAVGAKRAEVIRKLASLVSNIGVVENTGKVDMVYASLPGLRTKKPFLGLKSYCLGFIAVLILFFTYKVIAPRNDAKANFYSENPGISVKNAPLKLHSASMVLHSPTSSADAKRVAVLYFDNTGKSAELDVLRKGFADMLITDMNGKGGLSIVEREKLNEVLKEIKLQSGQSFDSASAVRIGKLLAVEYLVTGGFFEMAGQFRIDAKAIRVETGEVIASVGTTGSKNDFMKMEKNLATEIIGSMGKSGEPSIQNTSSQITYAALKDYSEVLNLLDQGKKESAIQRLLLFIKTNPNFEPAIRLSKKMSI